MEEEIMSRIRIEKEYQQRKKQITLQAMALLGEIGYEAFSVNKVIQKAGLTKGAFFHYFETKEELVHSIIDLLLTPIVEALTSIAEDAQIPSKDKIRYMFEAGYDLKRTDTREVKQLILLLNKTENHLMQQQFMEAIIHTCTPIYARVFTEGNVTGAFDIPHASGSAYLYLNMIVAINKEIGRVLFRAQVTPSERESMKSKIDAFEAYAKSLFAFNHEEKLYRDEMLQVMLK
jgi:AcrR family transcriptional regulator